MILSHTHWDRQWYRTVQEFRLYLGKMMDKLLELFREDPDFRFFHLDGQTAIIQDYLELRPWKRDEIVRLVREGKLKIGPWFLQPDTFLVSGEGLIRNLLKGSRYAMSMGGSMSVGWLPDSFGHNSQMPQILKNFGICSFLFSRGLGDQFEGKAGEFVWEAPNGDTVLAVLQQGGYYGGGNLAYPFFWGDTDSMRPDRTIALKRVERLKALYEKHSVSDVIPIWNGADHMAPEVTLSETIRSLDSNLPGCRVIHGAIEHYMETLEARQGSLPKTGGELRGARYEPILSSVLSSRMPIKQRNYRIERMLERLTEPLSTAASIFGAAYPRSELEDGWDGVLKNHFHDAICGCSIDQAHKEMEYGFEKAEQTARELNRWALDHIAEHIFGNETVRPHGKEHINLLAFNPLPRAFSDTREIIIEVPKWTGDDCVLYDYQDHLPVQILDYKERLDQWIPEQLTCEKIRQNVYLFQQNLYALENRAIVSTEIIQHPGSLELKLQLAQRSLEPAGVIEELLQALGTYPAETVFNIRAGYYSVRMVVPLTLPPFGYRISVLRKAGTSGQHYPSWFSPVHAGADYLENSRLRVLFNSDGSIDIVDKKDGSVLKDVHRFQDQADRGDTYDFCSIGSENGMSTMLHPSVVSMKQTERGPVRGAFLIEYSVSVPRSLSSETRNRRSREQVVLNITCEVRLSWNSRFVEFVTAFKNNALDHRLRVYFPAYGKIQRVHSDGQFMVTVREPFAPGQEDWAAPPPPVFPHDTWFAAGNGEKGIAIFTEGLPEHAVETDGTQDFLALTLLRSVGWLSRQDLSCRPGHGGPSIETPDAQCEGFHSFRYGLFPFSGPVNPTEIFDSASVFDLCAAVRPLRNGAYENSNMLSLIELQPSWLQTTAVKKSEDGSFICLRFYNPADEAIEAHIHGDVEVSGVWQAGADEKPRRRLDLPVTAGSKRLSVDVTVSPHEIVTLLFRPGKEPAV